MSVLLVGVVGMDTYGAFTANTTNADNSVSSGTVQITLDDSNGTAMFTNSLPALRPGDSYSSCVKVTYAGSLQADVRLHGVTSGSGLDPHLSLKVTRGTFTPSAPTYSACTDFAADAVNYLGKGAGVIYDGTLQDYGDTYAAGTVDPLTGAADAWVTNESHVYKLELTLQDAPPGAQALNATQTFTWEARNGNGTPYSSAVQATSGLVHYYRLGETSGTTATDSAGTRNGTYNGSPTLGATGALQAETSSAVTFGSGKDVSLSSLAVTTTAAAYNTVEFWMYWDGTTGVIPFGFSSYDLCFCSTFFGFNTANSGDLWGISNTGLANRWVHVAAQFYNGAGTSSKLWIDGIEQTLTQRVGTTVSRTASTGARISGWPDDANNRFTGTLDEVAIYNRALTTTEILSHYHGR